MLDNYKKTTAFNLIIGGRHYFKDRPVVISSSPRHQRERAPAQVFTRVSGVALGFRC